MATETVVAAEPKAPVVPELKPSDITEDSLPTIGDTDLQNALKAETDKEAAPITTTTAKAPETKEAASVTEPAKGTPDPELVSLKTKLEELNKKLSDKEIFIQRQGTEIGELRKARQFYQEQIQIAQQNFQDKFNTDPVGAMNDYGYVQQAQQAINNIDAAEFAQKNAQYIHQLYPDYPQIVEDVAKYGESIGVPKDFIDNYRRNPYGTDVRTLIPYVEGAKRMKTYGEKDSLIDSLKKQVADLDKITDEETVTEKIAAASKKTSVITGKASDGNTKKPTDGLDEKNISSLSDADLEAMLKSE